MNWQVLLVIIVSVLVAGAVVTLSVMLSRSRRRERRAETERKQMEGVAHRLIDERENKKLPPEEAADELSKLLNRWDAGDPPGVPNGREGTDGDGI